MNVYGICVLLNFISYDIFNGKYSKLEHNVQRGFADCYSPFEGTFYLHLLCRTQKTIICICEVIRASSL